MSNLLKPNQDTPSQASSIRSFVRRKGRVTRAQRKALEQLWPRYKATLKTEPLNLEAVFGREAERILEIGFGNGESLITQAQAIPEKDFLGIEVYRPGIGHLLLRLEAEQIENIRIIEGDAFTVLQHYISDQSFNGAQIFFPDPWPKKRHHKRRLIQPPFVELLWHKLKPDSWLHLATDWQDYAEHMMTVLSQHQGFHNLAGESHFAPGPGQRPLTKFEQRGQHQGQPVWDLIFKRSTGQGSNPSSLMTTSTV